MFSLLAASSFSVLDSEEKKKNRVVFFSSDASLVFPMRNINSVTQPGHIVFYMSVQLGP